LSLWDIAILVTISSVRRSQRNLVKIVAAAGSAGALGELKDYWHTPRSRKQFGMIPEESSIHQMM
jgi:hypothetical protein